MRFLTIIFLMLLLPALVGSQSQESSSSSTLAYDWKNNCRYATTTNLFPLTLATPSTLTGTTNGALQVDNQNVVVNDRILVKDQGLASVPAQNGIYRVTNAGSVATKYVLTRDSDGNEWRDYPGCVVGITSEGTANKNTSWRCTAALTGVVGTDPLPWVGVGPAPPTLASGTWTGSFSTTSNISTVFVYRGQYLRVGNVVNCSCRFTCTQSAAPASFQMSIPVASNFAAVEDAAGIVNGVGGSSVYGNVTANIANDTFLLKFAASVTTSQEWCMVVTYLVQ